jgi:5-formyltetrahydrofolate cyclo-ligase
MDNDTLWSGRNAAKDRLRNEIWRALVESGAAIGDPVGHIPNFKGAEQAAERLAGLDFWRAARVVKSNPDAPQIPVRLRALREGKTLYMAVPRLTQEKCFLELTGADLARRGVALEAAAPWQGAMQYGRAVAFEEMQPVDVAVTGCVAVTRAGGRTGKGAGFADLEFAMLREFGLVSAQTVIVTTVHPLSIVPPQRLPLEEHDTFLNWIVTPEEAIQTTVDRPQPGGIDWSMVRDDQLETIPILRVLKSRR